MAEREDVVLRSALLRESRKMNRASPSFETALARLLTLRGLRFDGQAARPRMAGNRIFALAEPPEPG
jgi:hypothetical protein